MCFYVNTFNVEYMDVCMVYDGIEHFYDSAATSKNQVNMYIVA